MSEHAHSAIAGQATKEILVLSSDSHVFERPGLWQTRIDAPVRDRAPRIQRIDGTDQIVILSGIGLISNAGAQLEAPETISVQGRFEDVLRGGNTACVYNFDVARLTEQA